MRVSANAEPRLRIWHWGMMSRSAKKTFAKSSAILAENSVRAHDICGIVDDLPPGLDQEERLPGWWAPSANGCTLITTRSGDYEGVGVTIKVDVLDLKPAVELLTREREPQTDQERREAEALAEDLGQHALALAVASLLLKAKGFAELREEVTSARSDPLGELAAGLSWQLPGGHEKSIVATLVMSVRLLGEQGLGLLRLAGVLHSGTPVPLRLARGVFKHAFALGEQPAKDYLTLALSQAEMHSLATISPESEVFSVHSLVRYTMLHGDPAGGQALALLEMLRKAAVQALVELSGTVDIRERASLELETVHAKDLAPQPQTSSEVRLSNLLASFEYERGHYREALAMTKRTLPIQERVLGHYSPDTLTTRIKIASFTGKTGDAREALRLYRELLPDVERSLGPNHPNTLRTRNNIALWTGATGKADEALRLFQALLPTWSGFSATTITGRLQFERISPTTPGTPAMCARRCACSGHCFPKWSECWTLTIRTHSQSAALSPVTPRIRARRCACTARCWPTRSG
jgi:hypothetical protein